MKKLLTLALIVLTTLQSCTTRVSGSTLNLYEDYCGSVEQIDYIEHSNFWVGSAVYCENGTGTRRYKLIATVREENL